MCVCVSVRPKGLSAKATVHEGKAGGKSTLRRFFFLILVNFRSIAFGSYQHNHLWLVFIGYIFTHLLTVTQSYRTVTGGFGVCGFLSVQQSVPSCIVGGGKGGQM